MNVVDCPLCRIFTHNNIITKLYHMEIDKSFAIVDCFSCKTPMVVINEHITSLNKEMWGRILYRTRKMFGSGVVLRTKPRTIHDHWHAHITQMSVNPRMLSDYRKKR